MKQNFLLFIALALFSMIGGYLLAGISLVGKAGINIMYGEYRFLKTWWKGALLVFIAWIILFSFQAAIVKKVSKRMSKIVNAILIIVAIAGLLFSYSDFNNMLSHRLLGARFHAGVYLFWLGWIGISAILLARKETVTLENRETGVM